jgi:hypothetical protein
MKFYVTFHNENSDATSYTTLDEPTEQAAIAKVETTYGLVFHDWAFGLMTESQWKEYLQHNPLPPQVPFGSK